MIIDNNEYILREKFVVKKYKYNDIKLRVKLKGINNITDMSFMFKESSLLSIPDISKLNTKNVTNMSYIFSNCSSLLSLPNISEWNTSNVNNMFCMFSGFSSLLLYLIFQNGILIMPLI